MRKWANAHLSRGVEAALLLALVGVACAFGEAAPEKGHPRIFLNAEDLGNGPDRGAFSAPLSQRPGRLWRPTTPWSSLRGRVAVTSSHAEEYALLSQWAEAQLLRRTSDVVSDSALCQESALTYALLYQLSGDGRYGDRAVALIRALTTGTEGRLPGFDWQGIPVTVATVFDWTYDRLSPEDRTRLLYDILKRGIYIRDRKAPAEPQPFDPAPYLKPLAFASLALAGEPEAADYAPQWQEFSRRVLAEQLRALEKAGGDGAWLPDAGGLGRELDILEVLEAWRTAAVGLPQPLTTHLPGHFSNLSRRILYRLRPGLVLTGLAGDPPGPSGPETTQKAGTRQSAVPPSLLYLLSAYEDQPVGRWLAETVRLADDPPAGSPAWLRDLRARVLWLPKGKPRLSPEEAGLPLAASFADTGEVIVRSSWDFTRPDTTWLLFRVSPASAIAGVRQPTNAANVEPAPFPYWNHLTLVRGKDALAVETNIVASSGTGYPESWFGTALAQNSVFDATGKLPTRAEPSGLELGAERFALEACTVGSGFAYMRGRVGRPSGEQPGPGVRQLTDGGASGTGGASGRFEGVSVSRRTREVVAFYDGLAVVRDRVRALSQPVWVLHMLEEPKLSGPAHTSAGTSAGGIRESAGSNGVLWQTGQSRGFLAVLLPRDRRVSTIGGKSYEFWSQPAGQNLWPTVPRADGTTLPYSPEALHRAEVGTWRVEIEPGTGARRPAAADGASPAPLAQSAGGAQGTAREQGARAGGTQFLTVLTAGGLDSGEPQASVEERERAVEAAVAWQGRLYRVTLEDEGTGSVEVTEAGTGKVLVEGRWGER